LLYYPGSGIEDIEVLLLRDLGGDSLHRLISHIRHRHDLPVLAPDLLPLLLGHRKPEYAAFGLELMAQLTAGGPRVMSHTR
jgi:hypothetical protein